MKRRLSSLSPGSRFQLTESNDGNCYIVIRDGNNPLEDQDDIACLRLRDYQICWINKFLQIYLKGL